MTQDVSLMRISNSFPKLPQSTIKSFYHLFQADKDNNYVHNIDPLTAKDMEQH